MNPRELSRGHGLGHIGIVGQISFQLGKPLCPLEIQSWCSAPRRWETCRPPFAPLNDTTISGLNCMPSCASVASAMLEKPAGVPVLITFHSSPVRSSSVRRSAPPSRQPQPEKGTLSPSRSARLTFFGRSIAGKTTMSKS